MRVEYRAIARVTKTHGKRGEVVAVPVHGLPFLLEEGLDVALVPPSLKGNRFHRVVSVSDQQNGQLVGLTGVTDLNAAEGLVGKTVLAPVDQLPADLALHDPNSLLGRRVEDETYGPLGTVEEVMQGPANDVWVLEGPFGEVLLPVIPDVVSEVAPAGDILTHMPQGFLGGLIQDGGAQ